MKNTIKVARAKLGITQAQLAKRVNVSRQTINSIEIGKFVPSTVLALKIATVFGKAVNTVFTLDPKQASEAQPSMCSHHNAEKEG